MRELQNKLLTDIMRRIKLKENAMSILVESLRDQDLHKDIPFKDFNCLVLGGKKKEVGEITQFLTVLENIKGNYPDNTRVQLLFRYTSSKYAGHWIAADIRIIQGRLEFILVDSAKMLPTLYLAIILIQNLCQGAKIAALELGIHKSKEGCGYSSLDGIHASSKIKIPKLHEQISALPEMKFSGLPELFSDKEIERWNISSDRFNSVKFVHPNSLPEHFGALFKNAQDREFIHSSVAKDYFLIIVIKKY